MPAQFEEILKRVKRVRVVVPFIAVVGLLVGHQVVAFLPSFGRSAPPVAVKAQHDEKGRLLFSHSQEAFKPQWRL